MANHSRYSPNYNEDFWREETLPGFQEVLLRSSDLPEDGKVYVMYHGTTFSAAQDIIENGFRQSDDGMLGRGVYVSRDKNKALRYPIRDKTDQVVLKLSVNVGKVKKIDYQGHSMQKTWSDRGYDTAWVPAYCGMVDSGLEEDCIWDPKRVKVVGIAEAAPPLLKLLNIILLMKEANGILHQAISGIAALTNLLDSELNCDTKTSPRRMVTLGVVRSDGTGDYGGNIGIFSEEDWVLIKPASKVCPTEHCH